MKISHIILASSLLLLPFFLFAEVIESDIINVDVSSNGSISFYDKQNNIQWGSSNIPGWIEVITVNGKEKIPFTECETIVDCGQGIFEITFSKLQGEEINDPNFKMKVLVSLTENGFELEISELNTIFKLNSVEYPAHFLTVKSGDEDGYIVAPHLQGILIPSRYDAGFMRKGQNIWDMIADVETWWNFESGNLNMPWFGAQKEKSSVFVHVETSSDCTLHLVGNKLVKSNGETAMDRHGQTKGTRISSLAPIWKSSKYQFSYPRKMRVELVDNGYVGMTQRYKKIAIDNGRFVTLKEKIATNPEIEKIIGAPDIKVYCYTNRLNNPMLKAWSEPVLNGYEKVNTTFAQVAEMSDDLKKSGIEKCMFLLAGWNRMGYDREHVDMWPPAEKCGGIEGLRTAAEKIKANGYLFALHDNYDDFYPDAPTFDEKYILRNADGTLHKGGIWDGGLCYITCPSQRMELLDRNMDLVQNHIPLNAYYFDVITNTSHYECYDKNHPVTRKQDLKYRLDLLNNINERGLIIGGERGTDWALPALAFCEGLSGGGTGYHYGVAYRIGITIPLFYLVYHECVVGYWQHGTPYGREDHVNHVLLDMLCAQPSSWSIEYEQWNDLKPLIKDTYDLLNPLHTNTAHSAMINHEVLSGDFMVQKSTFDNGTVVWVNYGNKSYTQDGIELAPKGYRIEMNNKPVKTGSS